MVEVSTQPNTTQYIIRRAAEQDIAAIRIVARISWDVTYATTIAPETRAGFIKRSYSENSLKYSLGRADIDNWLWVVEQADEVIGFGEIVLRPGANPDAELTRIYFLPDWQRKGIGTALLREMLATVRALDFDLRPPRLWLTVQAENTAAIVFYQRRGFRFDRDYNLTLPDEKLLAVKEYVMEL
jgi:ribosomal protein S18 acetylase RimI-like enzyme